MRRARSFAAAIGGAILVALAATALMSAIVFSVAFGRASDAWLRADLDAFAERVAFHVENVALFTGAVDIDHIVDALEPSFNGTYAVALFDHTGRPRLIHVDGLTDTPSRLQPSAGTTEAEWRQFAADRGIERLRTVPVTLPADLPPLAAFVGVAAGAVDEARSALRGTLLRVAIAGAIVAGPVAVGFALYLARRPAKAARAVATAVAALALERQGAPRPPSTGFIELDDISTAVQRLSDTLAAQRSLRDQWMRDIAHDVRTPLSAMRVQLEGIRDGVLPADASRVGRIIDALAGIESLVADLDLLARTESPDYGPVRERATAEDLVALVRRAVDVVSARFNADRAPRITVSHRLASGGSRLHLDAPRIERAVVNLLDNALRYRDPETVVEVTIATGADEGATIAVTNAGAIAPGAVPHLFDRLYRADTARSQPGHGLGLSIVRAIAVAHGGAAALVDAGPPRVTIVIRLPLA